MPFFAGEEAMRSAARVPGLEVWVNADVLSGPGGFAGAKPVAQAQRFIATALEIFGERTVLSLGWTTSLLGYTITDAMIDEMVSLIRQASVDAGGKGWQHITFPIGACYCKRSPFVLARLREEFPDSSVTLWTSDKGFYTGIMATAKDIASFAAHAPFPCFLDIWPTWRKDFEGVMQKRQEAFRGSG
mmetsp:Transcript_60527/g.139629  ORF Transcript_60527/g.139629 Transcript_60527/m.139629 type:complete len:187 (+) Transcript_60527:735-1295(+)